MQLAISRLFIALSRGLAKLCLPLAAYCLASCAVDTRSDEPELLAERAALTAIVQINSGGGDVGSFSADRLSNGGWTYSSSASVDTSGVANAAPASVYQSERNGNFAYTVGGLTAGANYVVRLHFAEIFYTYSGARVFNVVINGSQVITNLDIYATVGINKALVREFTVPASSSGQLVVQYVGVVENPKASGLEVYAASANAGPTIASAATASPNPTTTSDSSALAVLGADDGGEANLTYTWAPIGTPPGAVTFSANGTNAAKNVSATFAATGSYALGVTVRDAAGATATSSVTVQVNSPTAPPPPPPSTTQYHVNCGGPATGSFTVDAGNSGGNTYSAANTIATTAPNAAPAAVYQTERYDNFSYTFGNLTPGGSYIARLHFAEIYFASAGSRVFNVKINGAEVLSNFDIFAVGGANAAVVRDFTASASNSGKIVIDYVNVVNSAKCSGIEIIPAASGGNSVPSVATPASANPNPVTASSTSLSVLGADDGGEAKLTYTWSTSGTPPAAVSFSANGTNAAKSTVATFSKVGSYDLVATIRDGAGATATSRVTVVVNPKTSSISVTPASAQVAARGTQQFTALARDQFGASLAAQPGFSWAVSGGGTISGTGLFTAGASAGGPFAVTASSGSVSGSASVTVTSAPAVVQYSTDFNLNESPISEGGVWKHNNVWFSNVITNGGVAYGTQPNPQRPDKFEDAYAFLGGMGFPPNQYASGHVYKGATGGYLEVELLLRVSDSSNSTQGYECYLHQSGEYVTVARWRGSALSGPAPRSYFDVLAGQSNVTPPRDGDLFEAQIVGNVITVKLAGATLVTVDVSQFDGNVFAAGDPGIGFCAGGSGAETANSTYGFRDFFAKGL